MQTDRSPDLSTASAGAPISTLFLRVSAAADYFTNNTTLMQNVPLVKVDISETDLTHDLHSYPATNEMKVLDPFFFNLFPMSLLPTAAYIVVVAIGASFLSNFIWRGVQSFSQMTEMPRSINSFSEVLKKEL